MLLSLLLLCGAMQAEMPSERCDEDAAVKGGKCKSFSNLTVCNSLNAGSLAVSGNTAIGGNALIGGNAVIEGTVKVNKKITLSNSFPEIALENGGNLLDYASFASQTELLIAGGAAATFDPTFSVSSPSITLGLDNQTITFADAGIYLLNGYMLGTATTQPQTGFSFTFANPVAPAITISGGVQTTGVVTTISGSVIAHITAGQTMTFNNASSGNFSLSDADVAGGARTVGVMIVRLR